MEKKRLIYNILAPIAGCVVCIAVWFAVAAAIGKRSVPYSRACREGWAPPPTNDVQRTIWKQVHAVPDKPIKIEFDPKKDK